MLLPTLYMNPNQSETRGPVGQKPEGVQISLRREQVGRTRLPTWWEMKMNAVINPYPVDETASSLRQRATNTARTQIWRTEILMMLWILAVNLRLVLPPLSADFRAQSMWAVGVIVV